MTTTNKTRSKIFVLIVAFALMLTGLAFVVVVIFLNYFNNSATPDCQSNATVASSYYFNQTKTSLTQYAGKTITKDAIVVSAKVTKAYNTQPLPGQTNTPSFVAFRSDNKTIASSGSNETIRLYEANTGKLQTLINSGLITITAMKFQPNSPNLIVSGTDQQGKNSIKYWDTTANRELLSLATDGPVRALALNSNANSLITLTQTNAQKNTIELRNTTNGQELATLAENLINANSLAISDNGDLLAVGFKQNLIRIWNLANRQEIEPLSCLAGEVTVLSFSNSDSNRLVSVLAGSITSWNLTNHFESKYFDSPNNSDIAVIATAATDSKYYFVVASGDTDGQVLLWNGVNGSIIFSDTAKKVGVSSIAFSTDAQLLAANYNDGSLTVWKIEGLHTTLGSPNS